MTSPDEIRRDCARQLAPIFAQVIARNPDLVDGVDTPAPVHGRPAAAAAPPATAKGNAVVSVGPVHGARARPVNRLAVDGPGATSP